MYKADAARAFVINLIGALKHDGFAPISGIQPRAHGG
jgi:hypothetical protein